MIFHFSIAADDPKRTATMLAELWRGEALPFPMLGKGSWIAHAGDDRRSTIEVYPRDVALYPADHFGDLRPEPVSRYVPFHAAVATRSGSRKWRTSAAVTAARRGCASEDPGSG